MPQHALLSMLLQIAGAGQLVLAVASLAIPRVLDWQSQLTRVRPLTRQVFWTYAGYIWTTNVSFGILSLFAATALTDGSVLAAAVTAFIATYWAARIIIQFVYFDRSDVPTGNLYRVAEGALVLLFGFLTTVYGWALVANLRGAP